MGPKNRGILYTVNENKKERRKGYVKKEGEKRKLTKNRQDIKRRGKGKKLKRKWRKRHLKKNNYLGRNAHEKE